MITMMKSRQQQHDLIMMNDQYDIDAVRLSADMTLLRSSNQSQQQQSKTITVETISRLVNNNKNSNSSDNNNDNDNNNNHHYYRRKRRCSFLVYVAKSLCIVFSIRTTLGQQQQHQHYQQQHVVVQNTTTITSWDDISSSRFLINRHNAAQQHSQHSQHSQQQQQSTTTTNQLTAAAAFELVIVNNNNNETSSSTTNNNSRRMIDETVLISSSSTSRNVTIPSMNNKTNLRGGIWLTHHYDRYNMKSILNRIIYHIHHTIVKSASGNSRRVLSGRDDDIVVIDNDIDECRGDCWQKTDCKSGLLCARSTGNSLPARGYNERKAYCDPSLSAPNAYVCYDNNNLKNRNKECEGVCNDTSDCFNGLSCTKDNIISLLSLGYNDKKAYCTNTNPSSTTINDNYVCYNQSKTTLRMNECQGNCINDIDCRTGLSCARTSNASFISFGYNNTRKAYCNWNTATQTNDFFCYNTSKLTPRLIECQGNCINDTDCRTGLSCARSTNASLITLGYNNTSKAYCSFDAVTQSNDFFCYNTSRLTPRIIECQGNCNTDSDCRTGLSCARTTTASLSLMGYNTSKAYCSWNTLNQSNDFFCYNTSKVTPRINECQGNCMTDTDCRTGLSCARTTNESLISLGYSSTSKAYCSWNASTQFNDFFCYNTTKLTPRLIECQGNCLVDSDCRTGLSCTRTTNASLIAFGYNTSKAYCNWNLYTQSNDHVCYNTSKLTPLVNECQGNCTMDSDCRSGLTCASTSNTALTLLGYNTPSKAYCNWNTLTQTNDVFCYNSSRLTPRMNECQGNCITNSDCHTGLSCARTNNASLISFGYNNTRKAYCSWNASTQFNDFFCFNTSRLTLRMNECQGSCLTDSDCRTGLSCASSTNTSLIAFGYNPISKAYCNWTVTQSNDNFCYDTTKIKPLRGECQGNCWSNSDCHNGLTCARTTSESLVVLGYSDCKAYCPWELSQLPDFFCYNASKVSPRMNECTGNCIDDSDCRDGLDCTRTSNSTLITNGYSTSKAYCQWDPFTESNHHFCYNKTKITPKIRECRGNCTSNNDCRIGLTCSKNTTAPLSAFGYNTSTAYCTLETLIQSNLFCYDTTKLSARIGECQANTDCQRDSDCRVGLACSKTSEDYLESLGYDEERAYCPTPNQADRMKHVCYNSSILVQKKFECNYGCEVDNDCAFNLVCAKEHQSELALIPGIDERKAYCTNIDTWGGTLSLLTRNDRYVCYDPKDSRVIPRLKECEVECDLDSQCARGLLCADEHKPELIAIGLDSRKAYCGSSVGGFFDEVCYDPRVALGCTANEFVMDNNKCCRMIDFDDINDIEQQPYTGDYYKAIPNGYYGLNWNNLFVQRIPSVGDFGYDSGFLFGTKSLPNHAFNGFGRPLETLISLPPVSSTIVSGFRNNRLTLRRLSVTSAFTSNLTLSVSGLILNTTKVLYRTSLLDYKQTTTIDLPSNFTNITAIRIAATSADTSKPTHVVLDNIMICS